MQIINYSFYFLNIIYLFFFFSMRIFNLDGSLSSLDEATDDDEEDLLTGCGALGKNWFSILLLFIWNKKVLIGFILTLNGLEIRIEITWGLTGFIRRNIFKLSCNGETLSLFLLLFLPIISLYDLDTWPLLLLGLLLLDDEDGVDLFES